MFTNGSDVLRAGHTVLALGLVGAAKRVGLIPVDHVRYVPIRPNDIMVPLDIYKQQLLVFPAVLAFVWFMEGFLWALTAGLGWMLFMFLLGGWLARQILERDLEKALRRMTPDEMLRYRSDLRRPRGGGRSPPMSP
ncbi:MAG TPA: hypothetical protein VLB83_03600 [Candidatus Paceibacterota bacterium]|nr:hypothetical protein [Candidatus Paceibacterota bacterium]